jgi:transposase
MTDALRTAEPSGVIVGVDTHKDVHVAVAIDTLGRQLAQTSVTTSARGLRDLLDWARQLGEDRRWGVEGTGSYGAGLTRHLLGCGETVREVSRPGRRLRRDRGRSDPLDAEAAARSVLADQSLVAPKDSRDVSESLRQLRATRRAAVKARTQAANQLQALLVGAPDDLRASLGPGSIGQIAARCARLRPGDVLQPREACKLSLRSSARRWLHLSVEIEELRGAIISITTQAAGVLLDQYGVGPEVAAALLITAGGNSDRLTSEASFAALCGVSPIPASSGKTHRYRLNRGGDRQANCALHTVALVRMRSDPRTRAYAARRTADGLSHRDIMRCIKRYLARELYPLVLATQRGFKHRGVSQSDRPDGALTPRGSSMTSQTRRSAAAVNPTPNRTRAAQA